MANAARTYLGSSRSVGTPLHDTETEDLMALLNANSYQKGAWILHMLRAELGDKHFFDGVKGYYKKHKNSTANSEDLRIALEKASGKDLKPFFTSWVYGAGHPKYSLTWRWNRRTKTVRLTLRQTQPQLAFLNNVPITITTTQGRQLVTLKPVRKETSHIVKLAAAPSDVQIDPDNTILKEIIQPGNRHL